MPFKADGAVPALDWDFRPFVDAHGTTPEPQDEQVRKMNSALRNAVTALTGEDFDPEDRAKVSAIFSKLTDDQMAKMDRDNLDAIELVTGQSPSRKQIEALPFRYKRLYIKSLVKDLNDPEA